MDHRCTENLFAVVTPGLETACAEELSTLQITPLQVEPDGVSFRGRLRDIYLCNLHLRTASRVLVRFAEFRSRDFPDLYRRAQRLPRGRFIRPETNVTFRVTCRSSRLGHSVRIAETLEAALDRSLGRAAGAAADESQLVLVRIVDDRVTISIDSSGELLHRRGYRQTATRAPLRESLAAGVLMLLGWQGTEPLADPMCGTGSFLAEGAMIARRRAPGLDRSFAFMQWPGYRQGLWALLRDEADREEQELKATIGGGDENAGAVAAARENLRRSGSGQITVNQCSLADQPVHEGKGLVVCNPPYGKRLDLGEDPAGYYSELGRQLRRAYPGWRKAIICPDPSLAQATGLPFEQVARLDNGGLKVGLFATGYPAGAG